MTSAGTDLAAPERALTGDHLAERNARASPTLRPKVTGACVAVLFDYVADLGSLSRQIPALVIELKLAMKRPTYPLLQFSLLSMARSLDN